MTTVSSANSTRSRILAGAARLFRRGGFAGTGIKAIVRRSGAPYGSLYHFFPGGKEELGVAAIVEGGETYRQLVEAFFEHTDDVVDATRRFFEGAAELLEATDYEDACPIATIALEVASINEPMRAAAAQAFDSWIDVLERRLTSEGIERERANGLAVEVFCSIEGAFLLARTTRCAAPLRSASSVRASPRPSIERSATQSNESHMPRRPVDSGAHCHPCVGRAQRKTSLVRPPV